MINSAGDLVKGKHLEEVALAAKRYTLQELLTLINATTAEISNLQLSLFNDDDFDYIFGSRTFGFSDWQYIFTDGDDHSTIDWNYVFTDGDDHSTIDWNDVFN